MKFLADVNIPLPLIKHLQSIGHEVVDARRDYPNAKDTQLIKIARKMHLIILTKDKDFLELNKYPKYKVPAIVIRLSNQQTSNIVNHIKLLLDNQSEEILINSVTIIKEDKADSFPLG